MASRGRRKSVGVVEMAHDLGVSTATISRALNGSPSVRRELADAPGRYRIFAAMTPSAGPGKGIDLAETGTTSRSI